MSKKLTPEEKARAREIAKIDRQIAKRFAKYWEEYRFLEGFFVSLMAAKRPEWESDKNKLTVSRWPIVIKASPYSREVERMLPIWKANARRRNARAKSNG